jgi:hypothetical protein
MAEKKEENVKNFAVGIITIIRHWFTILLFLFVSSDSLSVRARLYLSLRISLYALLMYDFFAYV